MTRKEFLSIGPAFGMLVVAVFLFSAAPAQVLTSDQVPAAVKRGFQVKFPAVSLAAWTLKSDKNYEAEFTLQGTEIAAKFDSAGKWLETESAIPRSKMPGAVRDGLAKRFRGYKVVETQTLQRWNEPDLIYEIHLDNAKEIVKAQLSAGGALLNQSATPKSDKAKE